MSDVEVQRTAMEERYRRVLRLLPPAYRAAYADEMVTTFLATVDLDDEEVADYGRPSLGERASVAALAVRLRLGGVGAAPRAVVWGDAVRLAVCVWLVAATVETAAHLVVSTLVWVAPAWLPLHADAAAVPGGVFAPLELLSLGWPVALLALVTGERVVARTAVAVALVPQLAGALGGAVDLVAGRAPVGVLVRWVDLIVVLAVAAGLAAFHREAPAVPARPWLQAMGIGLALSPVLALCLVLQPVGALQPLDSAGLASAGVVLAGVLVLRSSAHPPVQAQLMALALVGGAVLLLRASSLAGAVMGGGALQPVLLASGVVQLGAVAVVVGLARRRAADALRSLPPIAPA